MWLRVAKRDAGKGASGLPGPGKGQARQRQSQRRGREGGGGCQPTCWGGGEQQGNNEAFW